MMCHDLEVETLIPTSDGQRRFKITDSDGYVAKYVVEDGEPRRTSAFSFHGGGQGVPDWRQRRFDHRAKKEVRRMQNNSRAAEAYKQGNPPD